ncbi:GSCOCG00009494001-RA-CDS [Cotesia congregata]|uniref:Similar to LAC: Lachesin (Schistocerca americana) n=1 Tax=Cotesia congregata TaxID=51543 RepID=A0A8J2H9Q3_COTCN|nr:GSCOCG00009494001-RA-CDS [Cotesia congregata]CAG5088817.1 Similar to LAC: Lachesin (Schistocerca americana) [Cotesia congregata]
MKKFILGIFLAIASITEITYAQRTPTISYLSQEQIVDIGQSVELKCSVVYGDEYPVFWLKVESEKERLPISSGTSLIVGDSRFSISYYADNSTYTLRIDNVQQTDRGIYECRVQVAVDNPTPAYVQLQVRFEPSITDNSTNNFITTEGKSVQLECYANGYPAPTISWRRQSVPFSSGGLIIKGNILTIPSITKDDRGIYYCIATNGVGRGHRRIINVEVEFAPVVTAKRPYVGQALTYDQDLECHVEAYPPPAISWIKDGEEISNNRDYRISHFATADEISDTTLRVITVEKRQYGMFYCKASNKYGSHNTSIELFETIIPVCPPACNL